jgi:RNA polymerase sigma-70 factor, ECF subfamily
MRQQSRMSPELALRFDRETAAYRGQLYSRALRMTRNTEDAEDLVQDTLMRACGAFHRFGGEHPRAWLHRIMTNTFINSYRKRQREPRIILVGGPEELPAIDQAGAAPLDARPAETVVLDRIPAPEVAAALAGLPAAFRRALLLADVDGLSCRETAQVMGTPVGTVMSRLHRARAAVRAKLETPESARPARYLPPGARQEASSRSLSRARPRL